MQRLFEIALYPPLLLRSFHGLESEVLGRFHPATLAAALLDPEARKRFLRAEIVRAEAAAHQPGASGFPKLELRALERLADEIGESVASLVAAPYRHDPRAESYCPSCHAEYRRASGICVDCELPLRRYAAVEIETQLERT